MESACRGGSRAAAKEIDFLMTLSARKHVHSELKSNPPTVISLLTHFEQFAQGKKNQEVRTLSGLDDIASHGYNGAQMSLAMFDRQRVLEIELKQRMSAC